MKTLHIFYSYTGHTKAIAQKSAAEGPADNVEILDVKRPGMFKAYTAGCYASIKGKAWPIKPLGADLSAYDRLVLLSPIWAGNVPPAVNSFLENLPGKKTIAVKVVSASGKCSCRAKIESIVKSKNCSLESYENIKA
jgi:flavodoxin